MWINGVYFFSDSRDVTLRDLCQNDKDRIRQLVQDLARVGTEKVYITSLT